MKTTLTNRNLKNKTLMLFAILCITSLGYAQKFEYTQERELCDAAFKSLQDADLETFSSYCINEKRMEKMLDEMPEETPDEKGIKDELSGMGAEALRGEAISGFKAAIEQAKTDNVNLKDVKFPELGIYNRREKITNPKATMVRLKLTTKMNYIIVVNIFETKDDMFIWQFKMRTDAVQ